MPHIQTPNPMLAAWVCHKQIVNGIQLPRLGPARVLAAGRWQLQHRGCNARLGAAVQLGASLRAAESAPQPAEQHVQKTTPFRDLLTPFSDAKANTKLLALCSAQMLSSVATLMHETFLPIYLSEELHVSNTNIGNLQGAAQFLAKVSGSVSGALADFVSPAAMVILGASLSAANKPMYAVSGLLHAGLGASVCLYWVAFAKVFDRVAKGIREAPSKALMGELAAVAGDSPTAAFGLRQSMATFGMLGGALAAAAAVKLTRHNYTLIFALSSVPAVLAVMLLTAAFGRDLRRRDVCAVDFDAAGTEGSMDMTVCEEPSPAFLPTLLGKARALLVELPPAYWQSLIVVALLYMARFDAAFATLRAKSVMSTASLPAIIPMVMISQALLAAPAGRLAKTSVQARNRVLLAGIAALIAADMFFAFAPSKTGMFMAAFLLGVHMAMTHGISLAMIASYIVAKPVPGKGRIAGTAWSFTDLLLGVVLAGANSVAGRLCDYTARRGMGGTGCFLGGAVACVLSMSALLAFSTFGHLGREDLLLA